MSYYSGMLPGSTSKLYKDEDIQVQLEPLAKWCSAEYVEKRVAKIVGNENKLILEDGSELPYDVLAVNVGSRTRGANQTKGVWDFSLTTRPINELLPKIGRKEEELKAKGIIPEVVVCGAGAAGVELAFAFKTRWSSFFGQEIKVTIASAEPNVLNYNHPTMISEVTRKLKEKNINILTKKHVAEITADSVIFTDGETIPATVAVWATGAEPQKVTTESDLDILNGYFRVNEFL
jgi:NADH dehydrogenase FAD-containing subunit